MRDPENNLCEPVDPIRARLENLKVFETLDPVQDDAQFWAGFVNRIVKWRSFRRDT